jgi:uncharacterized protein (TIRG00374 family)
MQKKVLRISWVIGLLLFAFLVIKIGPDQIIENIKKLTWQNFLILLFLRFLYWALRTLNWKIIVQKYNGKTSFFHLFGARLAGHAFSYLTPSSYLGGEAIRAMSLSSPNRKKNLASVIVDKTVEILTVILFTIIGVAIAVTKIPMPGRSKRVMIVFVIAAGMFVLFIITKQKKGFFIWIINTLEKLKIKFKFIEKYKEKLQETDTYISEFYKDHKTVLIGVFLSYSLLMLFWTTEIFLTLRFIGAKNIDFLESFLIVTLGVLAFLLPTVPASLGTYELAYVAIFTLFGLGTNVSLSLTIMRRILALIWAGIGLLTMAKRKKREHL